MGNRGYAQVKAPYGVALCPVCKKGKLHAPWGPRFFEKDDVGFIYLPISMDEDRETCMVIWCPECNATLRVRYKYISIEHQRDDGAWDVYNDWELRKGQPLERTTRLRK